MAAWGSVDPHMRRFGLDIVGDVPWGTHMCQLYDTRQDLLEVLVPYLRQGLADGEACVWITSGVLPMSDARAALAEQVPDLDRRIQTGQMEFIDAAEHHAGGARIDPLGLMRSWREKLATAEVRGFAGLRVTGDTAWLGHDQWTGFCEYEATVNDEIVSMPMLAVCTYRGGRHDAAELIDIVNNHEVALIRRQGRWSIMESRHHRRTEQAARSAREVLAAVLDSTHVLVACLDENFNFILVNRAYAEADGRDGGFFPGKNHFDLFPNAENEAIFRRVVETGHPCFVAAKPFTYAHDPKRGVSYWDWSLVPVREDGVVRKLVLTLADVTEQVLARQGLLDRERRLTLATAAADLGVFEWNGATGRVVWENRRMYEIFGQSEEDGPLTPEGLLATALHPDDADPFLREMADVVRRGGMFRTICRIRRRNDSELRWIEFSGQFELSESLHPLRLVGVVADITEKRQAEQALRDGEQQLQLITNAVPALISYIDANYCYRLANKTYERWFGLSPAEIKGRPVRDILGEAAWERVRPYMARALAGEHVSYEMQLPYRDGGPRWVHVTYTPDRDETGGVRGFVVLVNDIAAARRAAEELTAAKAAAEQANAAKDQFLAALSHELRTPLTPILAAAGVLKEDVRLPDDVRDDLLMIHRNVRLETRLIDDLLDLTRISRGKLDIERRPVDIGNVVRDAARICSIDVDAKGQRLAIESVGEPMFVTGDSARLHQVFWNLIKNAVKFTPAGGSIAIRLSRMNGAVIIEVNDSGIGIEPELLPRLFRPFEQGDGRITRQFGGLGLGLAISSAIVQMHGGSVRAHSAGTGRGTTFYVDLPLANRTVSLPIAQDLPAGGQVPEGRADRQPRLRILLVEDHVDTARLMSRLLTAEGYEVHTVHTVSSAIEAVACGEFRIVISDLGLPDGTGHDLMRRLVASGKDICGIAVSGYGSSQDIERSRAAGFAEHLIKPVSFRRLHETLQRLTGGVCT